MLLRRMEEEWTPIVLKTWDSNTISGFLEDKSGVNQVPLGTFVPIKDKVFWHGEKTVIHLGLFPVRGNLNHG